MLDPTRTGRAVLHDDLADIGADVVKVEPPGGDPSRDIGPFPDDDENRSFGGYFQSVNRNKRSIALI